MRVNLKQVFYYVGAFLFFYFFFTCQEKISPDLLGLNRVMPRDRALWEAVIQTTVSPKIKKQVLHISRIKMTAVKEERLICRLCNIY